VASPGLWAPSKSWSNPRTTPSSGARCSLTERSALQTSCAPGIAAATASRTYVRDDRDTPLQWDGMAEIL